MGNKVEGEEGDTEGNKVGDRVGQWEAADKIPRWDRRYKVGVPLEDKFGDTVGEGGRQVETKRQKRFQWETRHTGKQSGRSDKRETRWETQCDTRGRQGGRQSGRKGPQVGGTSGVRISGCGGSIKLVSMTITFFEWPPP